MTERNLKAIGAIVILMTLSVLIGGTVGTAIAWAQTALVDVGMMFKELAFAYTLTCSITALIAFLTAITSDW